MDYDRIYLRDDDGNHFEAAIAEPSLLRMVIHDALLCSKDTVFPEKSEPLLGQLVLIALSRYPDYHRNIIWLSWSVACFRLVLGARSCRSKATNPWISSCQCPWAMTLLLPDVSGLAFMPVARINGSTSSRTYFFLFHLQSKLQVHGSITFRLILFLAFAEALFHKSLSNTRMHPSCRCQKRWDKLIKMLLVVQQRR